MDIEEIDINHKVAYFSGAVHSMSWAKDHCDKPGGLEQKLLWLKAQRDYWENRAFEYEHTE